MLKKKYFLYLDKAEVRILLKSLIELKNKLIRQKRPIDCIDELIMKVTLTIAKYN